MMLALLLALPLFFGFLLFALKKNWLAWFLALIIVAANLIVLINCALAGISELRLSWLPEWGVFFHLRMDGLSLILLLVTHLMAILAILSVKRDEQSGYYLGNILLLLAGINGVLLAADLLLFFICWEAMIVPLYFLVWFFGHGEHRRSAMQFFIFTQSSGLLMLAAIIGLYFAGYAQIGIFSFDPELLSRIMLDEPIEIMLCLGFLLAFLVKLPACPFHVWLADLFTDAPLAPLLLGIMVKTGAYAIIRFGIDLFPNASLVLAPYIVALGMFSLFYGAFLAYSQSDIRKVLAYGTVSHMGILLVA
ncbi:MAG TPA: proton-conducting transporter membrane subunit, partial [Myxococcota bacterium]|nr:proton-conducting transporter membrane subunit [Myxococcota bacterium]